MEYDLFVIGGGSAGLSISRRAAETYGMKVALADKGPLGGTCVNNGCIPKKMLYNAAFLYTEGRFLYQKSNLAFNWEEFRLKRDKYIAFLNSMYSQRNERHQITLFSGSAFLKGKKVTISDCEYTAARIVVATGSFPALPQCPGQDLVLTSDDFFRFNHIPKSVVLIGAGYISIETAFVLAHFKCQVSLVARSSGVLRVFDSLIRSEVLDSLLKAGVKVFDKTKLVEVSKVVGSELKEVVLERNGLVERLQVEEVISAIGRKADTRSLGEEIVRDEKGFVKTDESFGTSVPGVFAIGDVAMPEHMLTPVAIFTGRRLADCWYGQGSANVKRLISYVPTVVFSHPPSGTVGYTEELSLSNFNDTKSLLVEVMHPSSVLIPEAAKNKYKFVFGQTTDQIYGIHMHGYECDETLQGFAVLARNKQSFSKLIEYAAFCGVSLSDFLSGIIE
ncbi:glutathione reductase (NADPH) [Nematocida homosporus]|uniref:glutathione reductase (NADPH) n=1 Tax=Nematocida homosporus TaxID=1912981 RepID=UPI00222119F9|nr:glutathione reductase (NADPH) [Nematocida homosporus]KAI5186746.1 glutathione reductase (NADPH) [Nematocida homosporus]